MKGMRAAAPTRQISEKEQRESRMSVALTGSDIKILSEIFAVLAEPRDEHALRVFLGEQLSLVLGADYYASYLWSEVASCFTGRVALNMSDANLSSYELYYQFHDPITHRLRQRGEPTLVTEILPQEELIKTEFFNDFLRHDGLYWGLNLHVRVAGECTGDLRIWRDRKRQNFDERELSILRLVAPAFRQALRRSARASVTPGGVPLLSGQAGAARSQPPPSSTRYVASVPAAAQHGAGGSEPPLTEREAQIARLVASGLSDKEIAQSLGISFTTVRTHIKRAFDKLGVDNSVKLASRLHGAPLEPVR
jgi:DNA-binding CsgD family transcriptional regulator